ncbi:MAG: hypothetical protein ACYS5V_03185 [Planctomycetota bacterium]|jgi:hypothetical protein
MAPTTEQYERIGRFLDGEPVELTPQERALADEIAAAERSLGASLDVSMPPRALHRIHGRLGAELRGRRSVWRWARWVSAVAAAVVVFAAAVISLIPGDDPVLGEAEYVEAFLQAPAGGLEGELQDLTEELAEHHVGLAVGDAGPLEIAVDGLEQELGEAAEDADVEAWEFWEDSL